jgi:hypothetical protein
MIGCMGIASLVLIGGLLAANMAPPAETAPVYKLNVTIRPAQRLIAVTGSVKLPAYSEPRKRLCFQLAQQMQDLQIEVVAPATLTQKLAPKEMSDNTLGSGNFAADLTKPIPAETPIEISFSFHGGDKTAFVFHVGPEGSYSDGTDIAWYPQFGPETVDRGKFSVDALAAVTGSASYNVPADLTLVASGRRTDGPKDDSSAVYTYETANPTTFAFSLDTFRVLRSPGRIPVSLYLKEPKPNEEEMLTGIRKVVDELTSIYGPFPYPEFALVEVGDKALEGAGFGGAGCPGFMLSASSFLDQGFNMAFFGHEIGHQWWGNKVTHVTEAEGNDLLDEAIAQYGSLYCVQHLVGDEAAERYRWVGYPGYVSSQCGRNFLRLAAAGIDIPIGSMPAAESRLAHELACEKGFLVFDALRREIGDAAFHEGLKQVTTKYAFRSLSWAQFKNEVRKSAKRDLSWFWSQWLERSGAPYLDMRWNQDGLEVSGMVIQRAPLYRLKVPVRFDFESGDSKVIEVAVSALETPFRFKAKSRVIGAELDPRFEVLHFSPQSEAAAQALSPFTKATWLFFTGKPEESQKALEATLGSLTSPDLFGLEFNVRFRLAQMSFRAKSYADALSEADRAMTCTGRDPYTMPSYYQLVLNCADKMGDKTKARWAAEACLASERELGQLTGVSMAAEKWLAGNPGSATGK